MIKFDCVSFQYKKNETSYVLKEVSFSLKKGKINGLIGENGSGKTTIAKLSSGLITPTSGKILIDNQDIFEKDNSNIPKFITGLIFQNPDNQIVGTTVAEELAFGLENLCYSQDDIYNKIKKIASIFDFEDKLNLSTNELSGGQKQILTIASILIMEPSWIFFDEPTSHLDPWTRKKFWNFLHSLVEKKEIGIVVISQLPGDLFEFDHIIEFEKGNIVFDDCANNYKFPNFQELI